MRLAYLVEVGTTVAAHRLLAQTLQPGSPTTQLAATMPVASTWNQVRHAACKVGESVPRSAILSWHNSCR